MPQPMDVSRWQRLSPLLDELQPLPESERERRLAALAAAAPDDAQSLRRLLQAVAAAQDAGFLDGVADDALLAQPLNPGDGVGPWRLLRPVGEGGMGEVWHAQRSDGRHDGLAAVKLLKHGWRDPAMHERFRREGSVLSRLHHPGIAQLLDAGVTPTGQPFLVLEWVDGQRIDHWCDAAGLDITARLRLFLQVLAAVSAAHNQLVIHRDLKPSNIFVDGQGTVKLLDFGIARLLDEQQLPQITREGARALTAGYAAPEQFADGALGVATDVYALGVVLHELLTGQHPSGLAAGAPPLAYLQAAQAGPARRASAAARSAADAMLLAGDLDTLLACALAADPAQRYATAQALADDVQRHLDHRPLAARRAGWVERSRKFVRRNRALVAMGAAAGIALSAGVIGTVGMAWRAAQHAQEAEGQRHRADAQASEALQQRDDALRERDRAMYLSEMFRDLTQGYLVGPKASPLQQLLSAADRVERRIAIPPARRAELLSVMSELLFVTGANEIAVAMAERAGSLAARDLDKATRGEVNCMLAMSLSSLGQFAQAKLLWRSAVLDLRESPSPALALANCLQWGAWMHSEDADINQALSILDQARQLTYQLPADRNRLHFDNLAGYAWVNGDAGRIVEAQRAFDRAVAFAKANRYEGSYDFLFVLVNQSIIQLYAGRPLDSLALIRQTRQSERFGQNALLDPAVAKFDFEDLALHQLDEQQSALTESDRVLDLLAKKGLRQVEHRAHLHRVSILRALGRLNEATAWIAKTRQRFPERAAHSFHHGVLRAEEGLIAAARRQPSEARRLLDDAVNMLAASPNGQMHLVPVLLHRGALRLAQGDLAGADADAQDAQRRLRASLGPDLRSLHKGDAWWLRAQLAERQGDVAAARRHSHEAAVEYADSIGPTHPKTRRAQAAAGDTVARR